MKTYFVSPNGTRDGLVDTHPCSIQTYCRVAEPGDTALLFNGEYTLPTNLLGTADVHGRPRQPITFSAMTPGQVMLGGDFTYPTVELRDCSHLRFEGLDFVHGNPGTVRLRSCHDIEFVDCMAWENAPSMSSLWWVSNNCHHVTFRRCGGGGSARKIWEVSDSEFITLRGCYGRLEHNERQGPKMTLSACYRSRFVEVIGGVFEIDMSRMPPEYNLLDGRGQPVDRITDGSVDQLYGIIAMDGTRHREREPARDYDKRGDVLLRNVTVFTRADARCPPLLWAAVGFQRMDGLVLENVTAALNHPELPFRILNLDPGVLEYSHRLNTTSIGGRRLGNGRVPFTTSFSNFGTDTYANTGVADLYLPPGMRERIKAVGGPDVPLTIKVE